MPEVVNAAAMTCAWLRQTPITSAGGGPENRQAPFYRYVCEPNFGGGGRFSDPGGSGRGEGGPPGRNAGDRSQPTPDATVKGECDGNPVIRSTGNKIEPELDFTGRGEMPLHLQRTYNHYWNGIGIFGKHWLSNFDYSLATSIANGVQVLWVQYPDGRRIKFVYNAATGRYDEDKPQAVAWAISNAGGGYTIHNESHGVEIYRADGRITELRNAQGIAWTFTYLDQYLQKVRHTSGREVSFTWSGTQLTQVTDPGLNVYTYSYTPNAFGAGRGRLASATLPGAPATTISYHYEDSRFPGGLTGKSFNGIRYSVFAYDASARAGSTEHVGGIEKYSFAYAVASNVVLPPPPPPGGFFNEREREGCTFRSGEGWRCNQPLSLPGDPTESTIASDAATGDDQPATTAATGVEVPTQFTVTVTNPLNKQTSYLYENDRLKSVTGAASPNCPASFKESTYDANGYQDLVTDFENGLTNYDFDAHGHLIQTIEAQGKPEQRTTVYTWDEAKNRVLTVTVAGHNRTSYEYATDGRIATVEVTNLSANGVPDQSRTTSFDYATHTNGMLATAAVDGPLVNDTVTSTYSDSGDLLSVADAAGTTTYGGYNGLGLPGHSIGPNGDRTDFAYDARGRISAVKPTVNGVLQTYSYVYDGFGRLASITMPNGVKQGYQYDVGGRIISEFVSEGAGLYAQKVRTYNAMSLPLTEEVRRVSFEPAQGTVP